MTASVLLALAQLPVWNHRDLSQDWLVEPAPFKATVSRIGDKEVILDNGLISRTFRISPSLATVSFRLEQSEQEFIRAVRPEALFTLNGTKVAIGGLDGQPDQAFLFPHWLDSMSAPKDGFIVESVEVGKTQARFDWVHRRPTPNQQWPPKGIALTFELHSPRYKNLICKIRYEMYDGQPLLMKQVTLHNAGAEAVKIDSFTTEQLAVVEPESLVEFSSDWMKPQMTVFSDYSFGGMAQTNSNRTVYWSEDPLYQTQVNYDRKTPCLLEVRPPVGPGQTLAPVNTFSTFRTFEILHDSTDRERQGLAVRRAYRLLAPWTSQNPIMLHLTSTDPKVVHTAIDQAAECGFEMIVISFWSGLNMEDVSPANLAKFKEFADYAHSKGLELGGYSLLASRSIDKVNDVVNPKPIFGSSPCLESAWGQSYFANLKRFIEETGFDLLEHDGSYPGDTCASTVHPGHTGYEDSQWNQFQEISDFYQWCQARGMYLNVPDTYFLTGSNKTGMGYRESNWSLPRSQQHIHARQNLYDGTWLKTPSMGWMMVPLVEYQGGGKEATIEPLREHLQDYKLHLINNFAYGAQACYRGPRIYDSPETKALVIQWVNWFKTHRALLESDVIHIRRADGRRLDAILHVNSSLATPGLLAVWNPTQSTLEETIHVNLAYTGLSGQAKVSREDGKARLEKLDATKGLSLKIKLPAQGFTWITFSR